MPLTPEERKANLAKGRETAAANRKRRAEEAAAQAAAPEAAPIAMPPIEHEGVGRPMEIEADEPDDGPVPTDDFERFLAAQDAETREILSDRELRVIYETETQRAADERKAQVKKTVAARALRHARVTSGLIPSQTAEMLALRDKLAQKVTWTVNMPEAGNSGTLVDQGVRINGVLYVHGTQVTGTLGEYISYREIEYRAHENERQFMGRSRMSRLAQTGMRFLNNEGQA